MTALLTGGLGLAVQLNATDLPTTFKQLVARHVDVPQEIRRATRADLERKGYRVVEAGQPADARLVIRGNYALGLASLLGDERGAGTTLNAELTRASDGRTLYRRGRLRSERRARAEGEAAHGAVRTVVQGRGLDCGAVQARA